MNLFFSAEFFKTIFDSDNYLATKTPNHLMNPNNDTRFKRLRHQILRLRHRTFDTVITDVIMPAKAPIYLKTKNGKDGKRYREALSAEMISHPLGDVRHTAHVGHGSDDVFGDTTFLKVSFSCSISVFFLILFGFLFFWLYSFLITFSCFGKSPNIYINFRFKKSF